MEMERTSTGLTSSFFLAMDSAEYDPVDSDARTEETMGKAEASSSLCTELF